MPCVTEVASQASWSQDRLDSPVTLSLSLPTSTPLSTHGSSAVTPMRRRPCAIPAPLNPSKPPATRSEEESRRIRAETAEAFPLHLLSTWKRQLLQPSVIPPRYGFDLHHERRPSTTCEPNPAVASPPAEPPQSPLAPPATVPHVLQTAKARSQAATSSSLSRE